MTRMNYQDTFTQSAYALQATGHPIREQAGEADVREARYYKLVEGDTYAVEDVMRAIEAHCRIGNSGVLDQMLERLGLVSIPRPLSQPTAVSRETSHQLAEVLRAVAVIAEAMADGKLTREEMGTLEREVPGAQRALETILIWSRGRKGAGDG